MISYIKEHFPELPIHTSTQMTITGAEGAKLLKNLGVERVVLARELSIAEMKQIREEANVELEAFVHGALCYSFSGQCLFSSMLGGRSGNRGRCAQPCRLPYAVLDENKKEYLIPAIPPVVIDTDVVKGVIKIRPLKGIFDDED